MTNVIVILVLLAVLGAAAGYVYRAKKRGEKCVGCPYAKQCGAAGGCRCEGK
ncbi:MAG: FeoB-associated Cys-rich membrane protein [bacterium]|nr:FeoB-associated Cys-rich membrane protein [bacterium]